MLSLCCPLFFSSNFLIWEGEEDDRWYVGYANFNSLSPFFPTPTDDASCSVLAVAVYFPYTKMWLVNMKQLLPADNLGHCHASNQLAFEFPQDKDTQPGIFVEYRSSAHGAYTGIRRSYLGPICEVRSFVLCIRLCFDELGAQRI